MVFFTADTHFNDMRIFDACRRHAFGSLAEMDEGVVKCWNSVVGKKDVVYHLGDFAYVAGAKDIKAYRKRLNGTIHLVLGNHDKFAPDAGCFDSTIEEELTEVEVDGRLVLISHAPIWDKRTAGQIALYGHTHETHRFEIERPGLVNVCMDAWNFRPVSAATLFEGLAQVGYDSERVGTPSPVGAR